MSTHIMYRGRHPFGHAGPLLPDDITSMLSTSLQFPANISLSANTALPWDLMEGQVGSRKTEVFGKLGTYAGIMGSAIGCAFLMHYLFDGWFPFWLGLVSGGALATVSILQVSEMKFSGPGVDFGVKLDAVAKTAKEAKQLAQLTTEIAFLIGNRPRGVLGGGRPSQNDGVRKVVAERLLELGFDKEEGAKIAEFDDPHICQRIIKSLILKAVAKVPGYEDAESSDITTQLLGLNAPRDPDGIEAVLGNQLLQDSGVRSAVNFFRQWYDSEARLYFVVERLDQLKNAETERD